MKPRIKSVIWNIRKQKTANQNNKKKKELKKKEDSVRCVCKCSSIYITRVPEVEEKGQEIGNYLKK